MHIRDRHRLREAADFRVAIAGHEQHAREAVVRTKVEDEPAAVGARDVVKAEHGRVLVVDEHDTLQSRWFLRRKRESRRHASTARDSHF